MPGWPLCLGLCALGCSASPPIGSSRPPRTAPPTTAEASSKAPTHAPAALQKTFTGQQRPSLLVKNTFPLAQHLFVDWTHQALLAPGASQPFELAPGTHTITCADSADPDDHPAAITEAFDAGYAYVYELRPGG